MRAILSAVVGALLIAGCGATSTPGPGASTGGGGGAPARVPGAPPGGGQTSPPALWSPAATVSLSGDWTLLHRMNPVLSLRSTTTVSGILRLVQSGTSVTGTYTPDDPPTAVPVVGTLSGRSLSMQIGPVMLDGGATLTLADTLEVGGGGGERLDVGAGDPRPREPHG